MKSEKFATALLLRRSLLMCVVIWGAVANYSLFTPFPTYRRLPVAFPSSLLNAQGVQRGDATFYGRKATGRMTANGERLHHDSMTCAHRTYPFGTLLQVTNTQNGKKVVVRVTDRGPFAPGRIIDLSWGAARELGILQQGVCPVVVEQVFPVRIPLRTDIKYEAPRFSTDGLVLGVSLDSLISSWRLVR